jgi:hypothetical protein
VQPTKPIAGAIGEESKPGPGAKRPPKTAEAKYPNCGDDREGKSVDRMLKCIEERPVR